MDQLALLIYMSKEHVIGYINTNVKGISYRGTVLSQIVTLGGSWPVKIQIHPRLTGPSWHEYYRFVQF